MSSLEFSIDLIQTGYPPPWESLDGSHNPQYLLI
jgi:hypothetical protein